MYVFLVNLFKIFYYTHKNKIKNNLLNIFLVMVNYIVEFIVFLLNLKYVKTIKIIIFLQYRV